MRRLYPLTILLTLFGMPGESFPERDTSAPFQEWQVLASSTGRPIAFHDWVTDLLGASVLYIGEEHQNAHHIQAAFRILRALLDHDRKPALALEMFGWDAQRSLDRYLSDPDLPREQFIQESRWTQNWGGNYSDYEPLINFARNHHLAVIALNPPRPLVREIAKEGIEKARMAPAMAQWDMREHVLIEDTAYRDKIVSQLRSCHGGLSDAAYEYMYEASVFRDEAMAKTITQYLRRGSEPAGPVVSYTGGGHIQYRLPIPDRVTRRYGEPIRQITIYLSALDPADPNDIEDLPRSAIADYIWLTPMGAHGPSRKCF
jgi:uncharacterized iron-regulated protein